MDELNDVVKILEEEYGVRSMADLDDAITKLNCGETIPAIDQELVFSIQKAEAAAGASKYDVEELLLTTIHDDTAPLRNFTHRDSLYVLELCMSGDWVGAESIIRKSRMKVSRL